MPELTHCSHSAYSHSGIGEARSRAASLFEAFFCTELTLQLDSMILEAFTNFNDSMILCHI